MTSVGHFHYCFFEPSETFIYNQLRGLKRYRPVAVSLISRDLGIKTLPNGVAYEVGFPLPRPGMQFFEPLRRGALRVAAELFAQEGISLLHAHFGTWGAYALPLKRSLKIPMVVTFYGQDVSLLPRRTIWRNRFQRLWDRVDLFLAEGPHMKAELIKLGAPKDKVRLQRIGIGVSEIEFRARLRKKGKAFTALWAGRMTEKKGLLDAIKAVVVLKDKGLDLKLKIIGDGPERRTAEKLVREKNLGDKVEFLGFVDYKTYLAAFKDADFLLAPSKKAISGDTEGGAPTTILEAQARGIPVVSTRHADIPFVLPEDYPYLAEEGNPRDLAETIENLIRDRAKFPAIARRGRRYVEKYHDLTETTATLEAHYDRLLGK